MTVMRGWSSSFRERPPFASKQTLSVKVEENLPPSSRVPEALSQKITGFLCYGIFMIPESVFFPQPGVVKALLC